MTEARGEARTRSRKAPPLLIWRKLQCLVAGHLSIASMPDSETVLMRCWRCGKNSGPLHLRTSSAPTCGTFSTAHTYRTEVDT